LIEIDERAASSLSPSGLAFGKPKGRLLRERVPSECEAGEGFASQESSMK